MHGILRKETFMTYLAMQARLEDDGFIYIINKSLQQIGWKETTIRHHIAELKHEGWLEDYTVSGFSNRFKPLKPMKCPDFIYNPKLSREEKLFLIDVIKTKTDNFSKTNLEKLTERNKLERIINPFIEKFGTVEEFIKKIKPITTKLPEEYTKYENGYQIKQLNYETKYTCQYCGETDPIRFTKMSKITCVSCKAKRKYNSKRQNFSKYLLSSSKSGSKNRGRYIEHNITQQDIQEQLDKQNNKCYYTNLEFDLENYPSIDRINSNIGYNKDNIVICLQRVNIMKSDMDLNQFKYYIEKIYNNIQNF